VGSVRRRSPARLELTKTADAWNAIIADNFCRPAPAIRRRCRACPKTFFPRADAEASPASRLRSTALEGLLRVLAQARRGSGITSSDKKGRTIPMKDFAGKIAVITGGARAWARAGASAGREAATLRCATSRPRRWRRQSLWSSKGCRQGLRVTTHIADVSIVYPQALSRRADRAAGD